MVAQHYARHKSLVVFLDFTKLTCRFIGQVTLLCRLFSNRCVALLSLLESLHLLQGCITLLSRIMSHYVFFNDGEHVRIEFELIDACEPHLLLQLLLCLLLYVLLRALLLHLAL